jgi:DNA helicase II / ATP-dependent DNA helicase PcrA
VTHPFLTYIYGLSVKLLIKENFLKTIPDIKREAVINRLYLFADLLVNQEKKIRELPSSFWVRKIKGSNNIFKFRLNSGDRILFTYSSDVGISRNGYENSIIFLTFSNHDEQISKAKNISTFNIEQFAINKQPFHANAHIDLKIDAKHSNYFFDLNNSITVVTDDKSFKALIDSNDSNYLYYLNDEQFECVEETKPLFLSGSAGSGKTTVGIHKILSSPFDSEVAYFTYTKSLKDNSLNLYNKFSEHIHSNKYFHTINEFLIQKNNYSHRSFVNFEIFNEWYLKNKHKFLYVAGINSIDLWAEIRGIIKGFMGIDWIRNRTLNKSNFDESSFQTLKELNFVKPCNDGTFFWNIEGYTHKVLSKKLDEYEVHYSTIDTIFIHVKNRNLENNFMDEYTYLSLSDKYSIFDTATRRNIYRFSQKYQDWLEINNLFDENDLALKSLIKIQKHEFPIYDYVIIDEIQDLTELQIYALLNTANNKLNVFLSGDIHQIINPTYFSFGRIENLFFVNSVKYANRHLSKNYRSQKFIVQLANILCNIRKKHIAHSKDYLESFARDGEKVFFLDPSKQNLSTLVNTINDRHYTVIVVANEKDKIYLKSQLVDDNGRIFTINEIKGLEYPYIVTYNLISNFSDEWSDIFRGLGKKNSKYRYYFNLFYVGITRARNNLLLYEDKINSSLLENIKPVLDFHNDFDLESLSLLEFSSPFEWMKEAKRLEEKEKCEQAIKAYRKAISIDGANTGIIRCQSKQLALKGKFEEAGDLLMSQNLLSLDEDDIELIFEMFDKADNPYLRLKAELWSGLFKPDEIDSNLKKFNRSIFDLIDINVMSENDLLLFSNKYFNPKLVAFNEKVDEANRILDEAKFFSTYYKENN